MSTAQTVAISVIATIVVIALLFCVFYCGKLVLSIWKSFGSIEKSLKALRVSIDHSIVILGGIQSELAYMRNLTTQAAGGEPQLTPPPVGRASQMPPAFPAWDVRNVPDAKLEDTDRAMIEQTDEDLMVAQQREEMRERGIEVGEGDEVPPAVREDV